MEVKNKQYEIMLVLKPTLLESAVEKKLKEFDGFLAEEGGEVSLKDIWGKRKLAYRIKGFDEGNYVAYNLTLPGPALKEIDNHLRIDNEVIRHLVVSLNDGYTYSRYAEAPPTLPSEKKRREPVEKSAPTQYKSGKQAKNDEVEKKETSAPVDKKLDEKLDKILSDDKLDF